MEGFGTPGLKAFSTDLFFYFFYYILFLVTTTYHNIRNNIYRENLYR